MDIIIITLDGTPHNLTVYPQDTVGSLKTLIYEKLGIAPQSQRLACANGQTTQLNDDSKPLSFYGLQPGSRVSLLVTQPTTIQVFLRNLEGQTHTYDIKPGETVSEFKTKVEHRERLPVSQQRLNHEGREMTAGKLSDYGVKANSTIYLASRLRGG